jgi:hypothetical protein
LNNFKFAKNLKIPDVLGQIIYRSNENKTKSFMKQELIITHMSYFEEILFENFL